MVSLKIKKIKEMAIKTSRSLKQNKSIKTFFKKFFNFKNLI